MPGGRKETVEVEFTGQHLVRRLLLVILLLFRHLVSCHLRLMAW